MLSHRACHWTIDDSQPTRILYINGRLTSGTHVLLAAYVILTAADRPVTSNYVNICVVGAVSSDLLGHGHLHVNQVGS